jgi:hypothetical protein
VAVWARPGQAGRHGGAGLSEATGVSYGVVEAAVEVVDVLADGEEEAVVEASIVEMIEGAASMMTARVEVEVLPQVSVAT